MLFRVKCILTASIRLLIWLCYLNFSNTGFKSGLVINQSDLLEKESGNHVIRPSNKKFSGLHQIKMISNLYTFSLCNNCILAFEIKWKVLQKHNVPI